MPLEGASRTFKIHVCARLIALTEIPQLWSPSSSGEIHLSVITAAKPLTAPGIDNPMEASPRSSSGARRGGVR
jgi:hypothetical protein